MRAALEGIGFGVVEGFYGRPWSFSARREVVELLGELGLSTYLYAPKSDPHHRARWWQTLPPGEASEMSRLAGVAADEGVRFIYGLSPERLFGAGNLRVRSERDLDGEGMRRLLGRVRELMSFGVREIALSFDDTWPTLLPRLASHKKGRAHALIADEVAQTSGAHVWLVPAVYFGRANELPRGALSYLEGLSSVGRHKVAWTGPRIFSSFVASSDRLALERATGAELWIWNNAIANDWLPMATGELIGLKGRERLVFGPIDNVAWEEIQSGHGLLLNGSREVTTTKIALLTFAELLRCGRAYRSDLALDAAVTHLFGSEGAALSPLLELVRGHALVSPHVASAPQTFDLVRRMRLGDRRARAGLGDALRRLSTLDTQVEHALAGQPALDELRPTARKAACSAAALAAALAGSPQALPLAREAMRIPWVTALDPALALAERGRFG